MTGEKDPGAARLPPLRRTDTAQLEQDAAARAYVKDAAGTTSHADQISQLAALRDQGTISEAEFAAGKAKILA